MEPDCDTGGDGNGSGRSAASDSGAGEVADVIARSVVGKLQATGAFQKLCSIVQATVIGHACCAKERCIHQ